MLPPIKITIDPADYRTIRAALKNIPENERRELSQDIRARSFNVISTKKNDFLWIVTTFAKYTSSDRDRDLIKEMLFIEDEDLRALVDHYVVPGSLERMITSYEIKGDNAADQTGADQSAAPSAEPAATNVEQGELFPREKPTTYDVDFNQRFCHKDTTNIEVARAIKKIEEVATKNAVVEIKVSAPKKKKQVVKMSVTIPEGAAIARPLSLQDRIVEEAVANLFEQLAEQQGTESVVITPQMVYRQINGMTDNEKVTLPAAARIDARIANLCRTWIELDYTEQVPPRYDAQSRPKKVIIRGNIVDGVNCYARFTNGEVASAWRIKGLPKLYRYSKDVGQIQQIPMALLNTSGSIRSTEEVQAARYYLIQQIEFFKEKQPATPRILFDTLFRATGYEEAITKRNIKTKRVAAIKAILDHFRQEKYITEYKIVSTAGKISGVDIITPPRKKK